MDSELRHRIEDFLYLEAELLDDRKLRDWLDLLTDDVRYWMPIRHNTLERPDDVAEELAKPGEGFYFDDDKKSLTIRVERVYLKNAWAEIPPSRTRHLISNVRIKRTTAAKSKFILTFSSTARAWKPIKIFSSARGKTSCAASARVSKSPRERSF